MTRTLSIPRPRALVVAALLAAAAPAALAGCGGASARSPYGTTDGKLSLSRVVLYRNGVGYFERAGKIDGDTIVLKVRKDQVNDLLKSLTVVDRSTGKALSVSMPLDPTTWANAAMQKLTPGRGALHEILDALRGADVSLASTDGGASGRIVIVEQIEKAQRPVLRGADALGNDDLDYKVTLLDGSDFKVVKLSTVTGVTFKDSGLALQFHRRLDASAGEGMFQQVDVSVRLTGEASHDISLSYVVAAPMWKPTYRIVLPEQGKGKALLQGWAVVDNTSGEDWEKVSLSLTSGAPIAFRYDLHSPRNVYRDDMSWSGSVKQARADLGEAGYADKWDSKPSDPAPPPPPPPPAIAAAEAQDWDREESGAGYYKDEKKKGAKELRRAPAKPMASRGGGPFGGAAADGWGGAPEPEKPMFTLDSLKQSVAANAKARSVSGLLQFDLKDRMSLPDGSSTMVAVINDSVDGEETYLFKPGGAGSGYEMNPYRVVRFKNTTPFVLEPGPISIYSGGSFVGEGVSEVVGTNTSVTIPFAVEGNIFVTSAVNWDDKDVRILKVVRGLIEFERFQRNATTYSVRAPKKDQAQTILVRHGKSGSAFKLEPRPVGVEDLPEAYLVPLVVPAGGAEAKVEVVERSPSLRSMKIMDPGAPVILETLLAGNLPADLRKKIEPVIEKRLEMGKIDTKIDGLKRQISELDGRADQTRRDLEAIKKDTAAAAQRKKLTERLESFSKDSAKLGREVVELNTKRLDVKIALEDLIEKLDFTAPEPPKK